MVGLLGVFVHPIKPTGFLWVLPACLSPDPYWTNLLMPSLQLGQEHATRRSRRVFGSTSLSHDWAVHVVAAVMFWETNVTMLPPSTYANAVPSPRSFDTTDEPLFFTTDHFAGLLALLSANCQTQPRYDIWCDIWCELENWQFNLAHKLNKLILVQMELKWQKRNKHYY